MIGQWRRLGRRALDFAPTWSTRSVARRLVHRANAARDTRQWQIAAALYEEALRLTPTPSIHKQCGHMYKEAGQFDAAERHYHEAGRLYPADADLALQLGHLEIVRGAPAAAAIAYERALALDPGWNEPLEALSRLRLAHGGRSDDGAGPDFVPELLPTDPAPVSSYRESIQIRRLGSPRLGDHGAGRTLRGVEAIRGFCISAVPLAEVVVSIGAREMARYQLAGTPLRGGNLKHVFNLWLDFSELPRGPDTLELTFSDRHGRARIHRVAVELVALIREADAPDSDTVTDPPANRRESLVASINARPSVVHSSARSPFAGPIDTIFVQRIDQLGDLVISVPALDRLRALFPDARIVLVVSAANFDFARTLGIVDEILAVDVMVQADGSRAISRDAQSDLVAHLRGHQFDLAIDLNQGTESRPLLRLANARFTFGFRAPTAPWLSASFDLAAPDPANAQEACSPSRKLLAMVDALEHLCDPLPLPPPPHPDAAILSEYGLAGRRYLLLHTGTRLKMNRWPFFEQLARMLLDDTDFTVVLFADTARPGLDGHDERLRRIGVLPFPHFDSIVAGCTVFVGNDSGPKHLAAIRGVPTISLHLARLNWSEWGQEGRGSIISRRVPCAGCGIDRDPSECGMDFACLRHIRPEEVFAEIVRLAGGT